MPVYTVEIDGKQYDIQGDHPPSEAEARAAVGAYQPEPAKSLGGLANNVITDIPEAVIGLGKGVVNTAMAGGRVMQALAGDPLARQDVVQGAKQMGAGLLTKAKDAVANPKAAAQGVVDAAYQHPVQAAMMADSLVPGGGLLTRGTHLVGRGLRAAAPQAMDMGLTRTMADRLEFPTAPQRLVDEGIVPNQARVQGALTSAENAVNTKSAAWDAAHPNPHMVAVKGTQPPQVGQQAMASALEAGKVRGLGNMPGPEDAEISRLNEQYLAHNTRARNLSETVEQKRSYQARANYNNRPNAPTQTNNEINFNRGVASANRSNAIRMDPSLEGDLAREQDLIGALTALQKRDAKAIPLSTIGTLKSALGLRNPTVMGSAAIGLDRTGRGLQSVTPDMVRAALAALMASHAVEDQ